MTTTSVATLDLLMAEGFVFDDDDAVVEDWYRNGNVRVVLEDNEIAVYRLTDNGACEWSITLTNVPLTLLTAVLRDTLMVP